VAKPFFKKFQASDSRYNDNSGHHYDGAAMLAPLGDSTASAQMAYFPTVAKLLGEAIPALSTPVGSHAVPSLDGEQGTNNFNLNVNLSAGGYKNGWPASRGADQNWRHADYLDVAYVYVYTLFDQIVATGALK
jgi:hypothetical protein